MTSLMQVVDKVAIDLLDGLALLSDLTHRATAMITMKKSK